MKIFKNIISAIYPNKCMCCGDIIDENKSFCDPCKSKIQRNDIENLCLDCGYEKSDCVCNYNIYRFKKLVTVFKNEGVVQKAYYNYKFNKKEHYAHFFANEMALAVDKLYDITNIDFICAVPNVRGFIKNTQYNHSGYIAMHMSEILDLPLASNILYCTKNKKSQHKSTFKERLTNVDGKYTFKTRIDGKKVLLVDDIRTTGATLDECAKVLLYAGADEVYCVTALATVINSKKAN